MPHAILKLYVFATVSLAGKSAVWAGEVAQPLKTSIPEPTVVGLIGLVGFLLMVRRRR